MPSQPSTKLLTILISVELMRHRCARINSCTHKKARANANVRAKVWAEMAGGRERKSERDGKLYTKM